MYNVHSASTRAAFTTGWHYSAALQWHIVSTESPQSKQSPASDGFVCNGTERPTLTKALLRVRCAASPSLLSNRWMPLRINDTIGAGTEKTDSLTSASKTVSVFCVSLLLHVTSNHQTLRVTRTILQIHYNQIMTHLQGCYNGMGKLGNYL